MLRTAYKFLKYDKPKSIGVIIGIVICTFLIGQQVGILLFLMSLMGGLIDNSDTEKAAIWVVDKITVNVNELARLDGSLIREIRSVKGVEATYPVVVAGATAGFASGKNAPVILIGSDPPYFVAGPNREKTEGADINVLLKDGAISAEFFDASTFSNPTDVGTELEINGKRAFVALQTKNARGFGGSYLYTSLARARYYTGFPEDKVSAIAVSLIKGFSADSVRDEINRNFTTVRAWKTEDLKESTIRFILVSSNIGTSIGSLVIFAIISGFFIIGLTLYSSAMDRIKDYGTLKAIGATNGYVTRLILAQSIIFSVAGFLIAWILLAGFKSGVAEAGLLIRYSPLLLLILFLITFLISIGSAFFFSVRTISNVEPASVFRN